MPTGFTVAAPVGTGLVGQPSQPFTVTAIGGVFNPSGNGQTITVSTPNSGDFIVTNGAILLGPPGNIVTFEPDGSQPSFTFTVTPSVVGTDQISFQNNQGWINPSSLGYVVVAPPASLDPITQTSRAILYSLRAYPGFVTAMKLVGAGKIEDVSLSQFENFILSPQGQDTPYVVLLNRAFRLMPWGPNSQVCEIVQAYSLMTTYPTLRTDVLNPLKWNTFIALVQAGYSFETGFAAGFAAGQLPQAAPNGFGILSWEVVDGFDDAFGQKEWKADTRRWISAIGIRVTLQFNPALVQGM